MSPRVAKLQNEILRDVKCVGFMIYTLINGDAPWRGRVAKKLMDGAKIGYIPFTSLVWKKVSSEALSFVKKLT